MSDSQYCGEPFRGISFSAKYETYTCGKVETNYMTKGTRKVMCPECVKLKESRERQITADNKLRDKFAMAALTGILSRDLDTEYDNGAAAHAKVKKLQPWGAAHDAYKVAELMLKVRKDIHDSQT